MQLSNGIIHLTSPLTRHLDLPDIQQLDAKARAEVDDYRNALDSVVSGLLQSGQEGQNIDESLNKHVLEWLPAMEINAVTSANLPFSVTVNTTMLLALRSFGLLTEAVSENVNEKVQSLFHIHEESEKKRRAQQIVSHIVRADSQVAERDVKRKSEMEVSNKENTEGTDKIVDEIALYKQAIENPAAVLKLVTEVEEMGIGGSLTSTNFVYPPLGLDECACQAYSREYNTVKKALEDKILADATANYSPYTSLTYLSMGSGGLFTDWVIIGKLLDAGFKNINIHVVDTIYGLSNKKVMSALSKVKSFRESLGKYAVAKGAQVKVHHYEKLAKFMTKNPHAAPHIVTAIDVSMRSMGSDLKEIHDTSASNRAQYYDKDPLLDQDGRFYLATHAIELRTRYEPDLPQVICKAYDHTTEELDIAKGTWKKKTG